MPLRRATPLKKTVVVVAICALTVFILLPAVSSVNTLSSSTPLTNAFWTHSKATLVADGGPIPPPIPPGHGGTTLMADGGPIPPPIPPGHGGTTLMADG